MKSFLFVRPLAILASLLVCISLGLAQQQQPPHQKPPSDKPQPKPSVPTTQPPDRRFDIPRIVFLTGKVVREDGNPLGGPVKVELLCDGSIKQQVYSSAEGDFSLQLGSFSAASVMDASVGSSPIGGLSGSGTRSRSSFGNLQDSSFDSINMAGCELRAHLPGFRSDTIQLGFRRSLDDPDVGLIVLHPLSEVHGSTVSVRTLAAPKDARKAYDQGLKELLKKNPNLNKARKKLRKAVHVYPEFAAAWYVLGQTFLQAHDFSKARDAFRRALDADPQYVSPYVALATVAVSQARWSEAAELSRRATEMNPYVTKGWYFKAVANLYLGKLEIAKSAIEKVQSSPEAAQYPTVHYLLGSIFAIRKNYSSAAVEYRKYLKLRPQTEGSEKVQKILDQWLREGLIQEGDS